MRSAARHFGGLAAVVLLADACLPLHDLDAVSAGLGHDADAPAAGGASGAAGDARSTSPDGGTGSGDMPDANTSCGSASLVAPLPDIDNSPVEGEITFSGGASWNFDGVPWPTFEIHTPTASYWLVKSAAAMVSITDSSQKEWINFSSVRPNRGVPNLGGCCQPGDPSKLGMPTMSTDLDPNFRSSSSHLRLVSRSDDCSYELVWDFFLTHFTLTISRAAKSFGFTYRGVPDESLDSRDQLVLSNGEPRSTMVPFNGNLTGPFQWAYFTHPADSHSLFLIQHSEDSLPDRYRIAEGDTSMFVFGGGQITETPIRFSLGVIDRSDSQAVYDRIAFVQNSIP
jgi:hypothetical protein